MMILTGKVESPCPCETSSLMWETDLNNKRNVTSENKITTATGNAKVLASLKTDNRGL